MRALIGLGLLTACTAIVGMDRADPRFAECGGTADNAAAAFAFIARDYKRHFPFMGRSPELEVDAPAFAVVFVEGHQVATFGLRQQAEHQAPAGDSTTGRFVCVYVGTPPGGAYNIYGNVDVSVIAP